MENPSHRTSTRRRRLKAPVWLCVLAIERAPHTVWKQRLRLKAYPVHVHRSCEPREFLGWRLCPAGLSPGKKIRRRMPSKIRRAAARGPARRAGRSPPIQALWQLGER